MASFAKNTFSHASYAAFRPPYPPALYTTILNYHHGAHSLCIDLGTGHGIVARAFSPHFTHVIGTDPSQGMISQARSSTPPTSFPNVSFSVASSESMPFLQTHSADIVLAGQAAHWFDASKFWPEMKRIVKEGGTLALWCYTDPVFVSSPAATQALMHYAYNPDPNLLGPYWEQPGRSRVQNKLRDLVPPEEEWEDIQRIEYEPGTEGPGSGVGERFHYDRLTLGECMRYIRTWSSVHAWRERFPERKSREEGGGGDVVDEMFEAMMEAEPGWRGGGEGGEGWDGRQSGDWMETEVDMERGSGLLLARRK